MPFHTTIPLNWGQKSGDEFSVHHEKYPINIIAEHWHDCFELICMLDGVRDFSVGETVFRLEAGICWSCRRMCPTLRPAADRMTASCSAMRNPSSTRRTTPTHP